jgi:hypothetical protein
MALNQPADESMRGSMATQHVKRKFAAVLSADVKGDSCLMGTQLIVKNAQMTERRLNIWNLILVSRLRNNMHKYSRSMGGWGYRKSLTAATFSCIRTACALFVFNCAVKHIHGLRNISKITVCVRR